MFYLYVKSIVVSLQCKQKQIDMKTLETTSEKQEKLIQFFIEMGYKREDIEKHYADPIKRKALNAMAEGL